LIFSTLTWEGAEHLLLIAMRFCEMAKMHGSSCAERHKKKISFQVKRLGYQFTSASRRRQCNEFVIDIEPTCLFLPQCPTGGQSAKG